MSLSLDDLIRGPSLPVKSVYIDALEDTVEIQTVALERYNEHKEKVEALVKVATEASEDQRVAAVAAANKADQELIEIIIAESLSAQSGMALADAKKLNDQVRAKIPPVAFDQISTAILEQMLGARMHGDTGKK